MESRFKMTLAEWREKYPDIYVKEFVCPNPIALPRPVLPGDCYTIWASDVYFPSAENNMCGWDLYHLKDFVVDGCVAGTIWLRKLETER